MTTHPLIFSYLFGRLSRRPGRSAVTGAQACVGEENVATTIVSAIEIIRGRHEYLLKAADGAQLLRVQELLDASEELRMDLEMLDVDTLAAAAFDRLRSRPRITSRFGVFQRSGLC
jgi:hypothetical protein